MKISEVLERLNDILVSYGDIECQMQDAPLNDEPVRNYLNFFIVEEQYEDGWFINLRTWPY